jgi:hypothetical protein
MAGVYACCTLPEARHTLRESAEIGQDLPTPLQQSVQAVTGLATQGFSQASQDTTLHAAAA